jgi:D-threonate/D-erythronate kinase
VSPVKRLIIVADDLAGAADCGVAFAERGLRTRAVLAGDGIESGGWSVLAFDTDTRDAPAEIAEERVRSAVAAAAPDDTIFKKIDSTLRGNLAAELRGALAGRAVDCVIAAPAFPATGRTTKAGRQLIDGLPLEESEFAPQVSTSVLSDQLAPAGLPISEVSLADVRAGRLAELAGHTVAQSADVLICDAETEHDLDQIARGGVDSGCEVLWMGTAGLARRLAAVLPLPTPSGVSRQHATDRPLLLVVGSPARATGAQLRMLREATDLAEVVLDDTSLNVDDARLQETTERLVGALRSGRDCALTLKREGGERDSGRAGTRMLAAAAAAAIELVGGLVLTGGETARAVLQAMAVRGLTLEREIQPGIALGRTDPPTSMPVALKAGGFGEADALEACRRAIREETDR